MKRIFAPLGRFSKLSRVTTDLEAVTDMGAEAPEAEVGLKPGTVNALWQSMEALYASGVQPGLQLCISHGGQVVLDRAIGHARGNAPMEGHDPHPMSCDTPINLFSAAKAVTAMLVHKLDELDYFKLDDPVAQHLPGFERHGKGRIRIRDVLTHRAGLTRLPDSNGFEELDLLADPAAIREMVLDLKPHCKIGGPVAYHAVTGGFVMSELMQAVTGESLRDLLNRYIKQPLGLQYLEFGADNQALLEKVALNAETGWIPGPIAWHLGKVVGAPFDEAIHVSNDPRFLSAIIPSANVLSTARDMAVFYQCLLNRGQWNGKQVFEPSTVRQAIAPDSKSSMPSIDRVIGIPIRYSPGFMLGHKGIGLYGWNRTSTFGHFGFTSTLTWARPDTRTAVALLTNGKPILGPHIVEMLSMFGALNAFCENRLV